MKTQTAVLVSIAAFAAPALAQAPFPFQGALKQGTAPAKAAYDLQFRLYAGSTGGSPLGTLTKDDVAVAGGLFNVTLDYGAAPWDGSARFIEIAVRPGASAGAYETLSPRVPVLRSPYAIRADAAPWSGLTGVPAGFADGIDNAGGLTLPFGDSVNSALAAFSATNQGTGSAGRFEIANNVNTNPALEAVSNGGLAFRAQATGDGISVLGIGTILGSTGASGNGAAGVKGEATASLGQTYGVLGTNSSGAGFASGVYGLASSATGATNGVWGQTNSASDGANGILGYASKPSGRTHGVSGITNSNAGRGVLGHAPAASGQTFGVFGQSDSSAGTGAFGYAPATSGQTFGARGESASSQGTGAYGIATSATGATIGVRGVTLSSTADAAGVKGEASATSGAVNGVWGISSSSSGRGVLGESSPTLGGVAPTVGVEGRTMGVIDDSSGVLGEARGASGRTYGVKGLTLSSSVGAAGVRGDATGTPPPVGATLPLMGVHGVVSQSRRVVGVQGNASLSGIPAVLDVRIGVRGSAPTQTSGDVTIGVQGDTSSVGVTEPFVSSGVRGVMAGSPTEKGRVGVMGESVTGPGGAPLPPNFLPYSVGVWGVTYSDKPAMGVRGDASSPSGPTYGVLGSSASDSGVGVHGEATSPLGATTGVSGVVTSDIGVGVLGRSNRNSGSGTGVAGIALGDSSIAVFAHAQSPAGATHGVLALADSDKGSAVVGMATNPTGDTVGVHGASDSDSPYAAGVRAEGNGAVAGAGPAAAALNIRNGAITVAGPSKPADTVPIAGQWYPIASCLAAGHSHDIAWYTDVTVSNDLVVPTSMILATVEDLTVPPSEREAYYVEVHTKLLSTFTLRVTTVGSGSGLCQPPADSVVVHYLIINPM